MSLEEPHLPPTNNEPVEAVEQPAEMTSTKDDNISQVERTITNEGLEKDDMDFSRVDKEIQEYASRGQVHVDEATSRRLRRMIDCRVLIIMVLTYFLQALDKGTLSFSSIMGLPQYAGLHGQQVRGCIQSIESPLLT